MEKRRIGAISTFISRLKEIKVKSDHSLFYRGHSDESYIAAPTIYRDIDKDDRLKGKYVAKEDFLYKSMITHCPSEFSNCTSAFDHLVKMQHYSLPTRLLDITSNPLVALYFACCSHSGTGGKHGEVLVYEIPNDEIRFYSSDTVSVISNMAKVPLDFDFLNERQKFLHEIKSEKAYFLDVIDDQHLHSVICVKAKLDNQRIIKQSGAFLLFGMGDDKSTPAKIPDKYLCKNDRQIVTLPIAQNGKKTIIKELEELSISEATLFPEIDNVAKFLKESLTAGESQNPPPILDDW